MIFPTSIVGRHDYLNALAAIGVIVEKHNFPTTTTCPNCRQNELYIFDDIVSNGLWLSCENCRAHGDIITFGAQIWNLSLPDTMTKFSDLSVIPAADANKYTPEYVRIGEKLKAANQFWADAETQVWNHGDDIIACRLREFGLRHEDSTTSGIIGVAHYDQIAKLCAAFGRSRPTRMRDDGAVIVYPFYDLPGRLTGFLLSQYNDAFESRQNFIPTNNYKKRRAEAGYFLLPKLFKLPPEPFRGTQFVSDDFYWVVQAQVSHAARYGVFLPLVASYSGPEAESYGNSWLSLLSAPRIFHAPRVTPSLISRACQARGYVSAHQSTRRQPVDSLIAIRAQTNTWQEALKTTLLSLDEINAKAFAERLNVPHDKLSQFFGKLSHPFSPGFADQVLAEVRVGPAAPQQKWLIIERDSGWWNHLGRPIINVLPKITKIIHADTGEKLYSGTITTENGELFSFTDSARKIENVGLLAYCDAVLAPHKKLVVYDKTWNARSHMFAIQMHPPELVNVSTRYGWDKNTRVFRFDKYEITETGAVQDIQLWPQKNNIIRFDAPIPVAPLPIRDFLTTEHENSYPWLLVAGALSQLVAPVFGKDFSAVAIPSKDFGFARDVLTALCCPFERATAPNKHAARGFFERFKRDMLWPTLVANTFSDDVLSNIVPYFFHQPLVVKLSNPARAVAPGYGWQTIKTSGVKKDVDTAVLKYVIPAYIQHLLTNAAAGFKLNEPLLPQVLASLHAWLLTTYNSAFNLQHALNSVLTPENAHYALFEELGAAISNEKIAVLPHPRRRDQPKNYLVRQQDSWWLNRAAIDRYFYLTKSPAPNWMAVTDLLQQLGVYTGEKTIHNMSGVLIDTEWCDQFWTQKKDEAQTETG